MGYQPIYDGEFDLAVDMITGASDVITFLESIDGHKLMLTRWMTAGPGGGNPCVTLRGTRRQFIAWLNEYYDPDHEIFGRDENSEAATWANAIEHLNLRFVA